MPIELYGREVKAYVLEEQPSAIIIDILQKDGDCPERLTKKQRKNCPLNCQNAYMTFFYDIAKRKVLGETALYTDILLLNTPAAKYGINRKTIWQFIEQHKKEISYIQHFGEIKMSYKGEKIAKLIRCSFKPKDETIPLRKDQQKYVQSIRNNPRQIIEQCGIKIIKDEEGLFDQALVLTENIRSTNSLNKPNSIFEKDNSFYVV